MVCGAEEAVCTGRLMNENIRQAFLLGQIWSGMCSQGLYVLCPGSEEFLKGDIRVAKDLDGLGCLGDMGWYCIRAILWAFSWDLPHSVQATPGGSCAPCDRSNPGRKESPLS